MKPFRYILIIFLCTLHTVVNGQFRTKILADPQWGCDSVTVNFSFWDPRDTIRTAAWTFGNGETATGLTATTTYDSAAVYIPTALVNGNTLMSLEVPVRVFSPTAGFLYTDTAEVGTFAVVFFNEKQSADTLEYARRWYLGDSLMRDKQSGRIVLTFPSEDRYRMSLKITSALPFQCTDSSTRLVPVLDTLKIPNVFSPNNDNINDQWIVVSNGKTVYSVKIYARTGTLIYQAETPTIIWDGRNQSGQEMASDAYFYIIEPVRHGTRFKRTGFVQLFR